MIRVYKKKQQDGQRRPESDLEGVAAVLANIIPSPPVPGEDTEVGKEPDPADVDEDDDAVPEADVQITPDDLPQFWQVVRANL